MNSLIDAAETLIMPLMCALAIISFLLYITNTLKNSLVEKHQKRCEWVNAHFAVAHFTGGTESTIILSPIEFVTELLRNKDAAIWQYYDVFDDAHEVVGGYSKLCETDCCAREDSEPGLLFIVADNNVKIASDPYEVRFLLRRIMLHEKVCNWIREQPEYSEYTVQTISLEELDALTEVSGISLWAYVLTWDKAVQISSDNYIAQSMEHCNSINCIEFDTLFAIDGEAHCIYQPYLEVAECGESKTTSFNYRI